MKASFLRKSAIPLLILILLSGCLTTNPDQKSTSEPIGTIVAQTMDLHETLAAGQAAIARLTEIAGQSTTLPSPAQHNHCTNFHRITFYYPRTLHSYPSRARPILHSVRFGGIGQ
jgi:hypothetical protein